MSDGLVPNGGLTIPERRAAFDVKEIIKDRVTHLRTYEIFAILNECGMDQDQAVQRILNDHGGGLPIQMQNRVPVTASANGTQASRGSAGAPPMAANQFNGHGSSGQSLIANVVSVPKSSSASNDNVNQENVQHQVVVVAATTSPTQTCASITRTGKGKSVSSSDQHQISVPGVYSSSDPVLAPSISKISGVGDAISSKVGRDRISAGPNHVKRKKIAEASDLSASENEKCLSNNMIFI